MRVVRRRPTPLSTLDAHFTFDIDPLPWSSPPGMCGNLIRRAEEK